jgi:hypothetical protein
MDFYWFGPLSAAETSTPWVSVPLNSGVSTVSLQAVCPHGIVPYSNSSPGTWSGFFECQYSQASVTWKNETQL